MNVITSAVAFIIVVGLAVLLHELGHFLMAKAVGVRVLEFAFGFPPKLFTLFERNGTKYNVCALPIGGYVRLAGQEPGDEGGPDGFNGKPVWARILVYAAGPFMNFVLALIIFVGLGTTVGVPNPNAMVSEVMAGQPAQAAGFKANDVIIAINGRPVDKSAMLRIVHASAGRPLVLTVERGKAKSHVDLPVTPKRNDEGQGQIGVVLRPAAGYLHVGPSGAVSYGLNETYNMTSETLAGILRMFHSQKAREGVTGPVGIAVYAGEYFRAGAVQFLYFLAVISINLGVLNLLPLLVVDGGHIGFLLLEGIRGRKLQPSLQMSLQVAGMVLILLAFVLLTVRDIGSLHAGKF